MSAKKKKTPSKWSKVLTGILVGLLILGLIGAAVYFLLPDEVKNGKYTEFNVTHNGEAVALESNMTIYPEQVYEFKISYVNEGETLEKPYDFKVDIIPNATVDTEFQFTVDGEQIWFSDLETLKGAFTIEQVNDGFTLKAPKASSMQDILSVIYADKTLTVPENVAFGKYYTLVISSYDDVVQYKIDFSISDNSSEVNPPSGEEPEDRIPVESIILDKEEILI